METKILTPKILWQDFKPNYDNFKTNIIRYVSEKEWDAYELYFTAFSVIDGDVRVYTKIFTPKKNIHNITVILVSEFDKTCNLDIVKQFLKAGYKVVTFDTRGKGFAENYTHYPQSLEYGNFIFSGKHLNTCIFGAEKTSLFLWCKITRQVISFIKHFLSQTKPEKLFLAGDNSGANIVWQVAGTDDRLDGIIPINNTGFDEFNGNLENADSNLSISEIAERNVWSLCCASPSYAKFINCPTLFIGSSNNYTYNYSSLSATLKLIPEKISHHECISMGCSKNLYNQSLITACNWINEIAKNKALVVPPKTKFSVVDGKLWVQVDFDMDYDTILNAEIYISYGNDPEGVRNWIGYNVGISLLGNATHRIKVYDLTENINIVVAVYYKNGSMYTSPLCNIVPKNISPDIKTNSRNNRIIYDKKNGVNSFFPRENAYFIDKDSIIFQNGALDIPGITNQKGDLVCYNIDGNSITNPETLLQFDCFTLKPCSIVMEMIDEDLVSYYATLNFDGSEEWQNIKIPYSIFVSKNHYPLKSWQKIKAIAFCGVKNILLNNIIWI